MVAHTERVVIAYSQGINQSASGTDKVNAIVNCHLATGRIGRPGMGPFSLTGQPNAMGGREVGGLANQLAAHMDFGDPAARERLRRFWGTGHVAERPGLKAVELFQAVGDGRIKALWIIGTNPAVSMPNGDDIRRVLAACPFVAVSDCSWASDTVSFADLVLPALTWGEKDGTVTNSERRISRQRRFLSGPAEARADWWMLAELGKRLGHATAFNFSTAADVFREHVALSALDNDGVRAFDLGGLAALSDYDYQTLKPVQWPVRSSQATPTGTARLFEDGRFVSPDRKASFIAIRPRAPTHKLTPRRSLALNTGRIRDQWHTMTRTSKAPTLAQHRSEPFVEMHPADAEALSLTAQSLVSVSSDWGSMLGRLIVTADQNLGSIFVPMHWSDAVAHRARADALVAPVTDPISGQPELKHTPVSVEAAPMAWTGFALTRKPWDLAEADWCVSVRLSEGWRHSLAGVALRRDWSEVLESAFDRGPDWCEMGTSEGDRFHAVRYQDGRLLDCLFIGPVEDPPESRWLEMLLATPPETPTGSLEILAGRPLSPVNDPGPVVCACFGIGRNDLNKLIAEHQPISVERIGRLIKAGTNCGSCRSELAGLIAAFA